MSEPLRLLLARPADIALSTHDIELVFSSFASSSPSAAKSLSLAILSRSLAPAVPSPVRAVSTRHAGAFLAELLAGTDDGDLTRGFAALSGVLQVAPELGTALLVGGAPDEPRSGLRGRLEDAVEYVAAGSGHGTARMALLELLSLTAGRAATRGLVRQFAGDWLQSLLGDRLDTDGSVIIGGPTSRRSGTREEAAVVALAGVAVVKLLLGKDNVTATGLPNAAAGKATLLWDATDLVLLFRRLLVASPPTNRDVVLPTLEALAYLTLLPSTPLKTLLATDDFLAALFSLIPAAPPSPSAPQEEDSLAYVVASLVANLTIYPSPHAAGSEAEQLRKLKGFASAGAGGPSPTEQESVPDVNARINRILAVTPPLLPILLKLARSSSQAIRRLTGSIYLALCEQPAVRGVLVQGSAAKALLSIIGNIPTTSTAAAETGEVDATDMPAIQALAKIFITSNPSLVFPSAEPLVDVTNSLSIPLIFGTATSGDGHPGNELLIKFECLMALTNLASLERGGHADRLASMVIGRSLLKGQDAGDEPEPEGEGRRFMSIVQELVLSDNVMIRRASMQLVCNLVTTRAGNDFYLPLPNPIKLSQHLKLLLALISSADLPTQLAASGAVATLCGQSMSIALSIMAAPAESERNLQVISCLFEGKHSQIDVALKLRGLSIVYGVLAALEQADGAQTGEAVTALAAAGVRPMIEACGAAELVALRDECLRLLGRLEASDLMVQ